jgi:cytoskeletal protein RodZ
MKDRAKALADLGNEIRRIREEKGLTLEDVTEVVKIRTNFLEDIENGNFENFPSGVYVRGFIKSYLRFLGAEDLWSQYKPYLYSEDIIDTSELVLGTLTPPAKGFKHNSRVWIIAVLLVLIAGLSFYGISIMRNDTDNRSLVSAVEEETQGQVPNAGDSVVVNDNLTSEEDTLQDTGQVASETGTQSLSDTDKPVSEDLVSAEPEGPAQNVIAEPEEEIEEKTPAPEPVLVLSTTNDCWVRVAGENSTIYEGIIGGNNTREFVISERVTVTYGRPASINVTFMGESLGNPGAGGNVERWFYSPDGDKGRING